MAMQHEEADEAQLTQIRQTEYPALHNEIYLDHAGRPPIPSSLLTRLSTDLASNLYGNPHSASPASQLASRKVELVRAQALRWFRADPAHFDLVFVANATAGIKLVADALRDAPAGFWYGVHAHAHTSLVGVREVAAGGCCFAGDAQVEAWLAAGAAGGRAQPVLFAYPAQSNMDGRRLPLGWSGRLREVAGGAGRRCYSLLDAAAYVSTAGLDLSDADAAPDFTVCSFYKIFGFPDLGALIVRKEAAGVFRTRRYFGGGTVDVVVVAGKESWHASKTESVHAALEDGSLPIHNIIALGHAMDIYRRLFESPAHVSRRTSRLANLLYNGLSSLQHANGVDLCVFYKGENSRYGDASTQGPILAFNMRNAAGAWVLNSEVEKLASVKGIHLRAGGLCNPGGLARSLGLEPWEVRRNFSAGHRCGSEADVISGKPTGMLRVSLGAISTVQEIQSFVEFLREFFVETDIPMDCSPPLPTDESAQSGDYYVESLAIYPIKSCGGWQVPRGLPWEIRPEGLAWDREWCLIDQGTGKALNQKTHPRMALLRPSIDLDKGVLRVCFHGLLDEKRCAEHLDEVIVPLSADPSYLEEELHSESSSVCGEKFQASAYRCPRISEFFSTALRVPCQLARVSVVGPKDSQRRAKAQMQRHQLYGQHVLAKSGSSSSSGSESTARSIRLSNESPILAISRSSLNRLNEQIKARGGKATQAEVFRANIVIAQEFGASCGMEQAYIEDYWRVVTIGGQHLQVLGSCRRCQMVCIDQSNGEKNAEPFATLCKSRRFDGKVWFGQHMGHIAGITASQHPTITVGASVRPLFDGEQARSILSQAGVVC